MATVPGVYVTITDRSFSTPAVGNGRAGLIVVVSDRGPHNRVVEVNSQEEFITLFGSPDITKYGQAHHIAAKFLERSNRLFVIKPSLLDSENPDYNAAIANQYIKYNDPNGSEQLLLNNKFIFTKNTDATAKFGTDFVSKYVFCSIDGFNLVEVGDYIYSEKDSKSSKGYVLGKGSLENKIAGTNKGVFYLILKDPYEGSSTVDINNANSLLVTAGTDPSILDTYTVDLTNIFTTRIYEYYPGSDEIGKSYTFTKNSETVVAADLDAFNAVNIEDWIYPSAVDVSIARQIVKKDVLAGNVYMLYLDMKYMGNTSTSSVRKYTPFEVTSIPNMKTEQDLDTQDSDNLWYFYAKGTGTYYNRIFVRGVRNVYFEKMYTDNNGDPLYKYAFLDITVYRSNTDGTATILEGPWTVSLMNKAGEQTVKDINSGKELYIVKVINERSKLISCKDSEYSVTMLEGANYDSERRRLQLQSLFSSGTVNRLQTKGSEGFFLENGEDGGVFDNFGRIYLDNEELVAAIARCYEGRFKSVDGSIESMIQAIYPWYYFDYVLCGGYPLTIQESAVYLADSRKDCLVLADTGGLFADPEQDLIIRANSMNWNSWNVAIYTQYRQIFDKFNGKTIWVSPTYHAIDCHLRADNDSWISDPVAGYVKGSVNENMTLSYKMSYTHLEKMMDVELNPTIVEPDGRYFLTQFTSYKPLSQMKRINTVKFVHYLYKQVPKLLKDILQQKATAYWIGQANSRISSFMSNFTKADTKYESISSFSASIEFDEDSSQMYIGLTIRPLRTIEAIHVNIIVT